MSTTRVYQTKWPTASMPSGDVGQMSFSAEGQQFALLLSRTDFDRLAKRMRALLREVPPLLPKRGTRPRRLMDDRAIETPGLSGIL
jgi:hypothetical protein